MTPLARIDSPGFGRAKSRKRCAICTQSTVHQHIGCQTFICTDCQPACTCTGATPSPRAPRVRSTSTRTSDRCGCSECFRKRRPRHLQRRNVTLEESNELIVGWRAWKLDEQSPMSGRLRSVSQFASFWDSRDVTARCDRPRKFDGAYETPEGAAEAHLSELNTGMDTNGTGSRASGGRPCKCGLYSVVNPHHLPNYATASALRSDTPLGIVIIGAVANYGVVAETEERYRSASQPLGYLSSKSRIEALFVCPRPRQAFTPQMFQLADVLRQRYAVPVEILTQDELLARFEQ